MLSVFLFGLALLIFPGTALAQADATLRVVVLSDDDGSPLPGANVILSEVEGDTLHVGVTDSDGFHEFRSVSPGNYQLGVSHVGFETYRERISLAPGRRVYQVSLEVMEGELDELVVQGERGAAYRQAGLQTITAAELERLPTPGPGDLAGYLQALPGVVSGGDRGGELYIRGGTPSQNLILVDKLPVIKPFHISNLFSAFAGETVRSVEVYAGGFGARYLGATSSVVDVSLRQGNMRGYEGSFSASPYLMALHAEGPLEPERQSFLAMVRHSAIEQAGPVLTGEDVPLRFYDLTGRYTLQRENATCNLTGLHTQDSGQINPDRNTALAWSNTVLGGRCFLFDERLDYAYDLSLGYSRYRNTSGPAAFPERSAGVQMVYFRLEREQDLFGQLFDYGLGWSVRRYEAVLDERFTSLETFDRYSAVVQAFAATDWDVGDWLTVTPSLGLHVTARRSFSPPEPRLRLTIRPDGTQQQEVSLALGLYHQMAEGITDERDAGTVFTVRQPVDVRDPLPRALHAIAGYRQRFGRGVEVSTEGYVIDHRNIPVSRWTPEARLATQTALAHGFIYGADLRFELDSGPFYFSLGYGLSTVTYEAASGDLGAWIEEPVFSYSPAHDRRHQLNSVISYELGDFTANLRWEFSSGRPYTRVYGFDLALELPEQYPSTHHGTALTLYKRPYDARMPSYHRLDLSIDRTFELSPSFALDLEAGAINLYDRQNIFYYDVSTFQRIDQMPLLPYLSLRASLN